MILVATSNCQLVNVDAAQIEYIRSPNYPSVYNNSIDVCWTLSVADNANYINWYFAHFDTEAGDDVLSLYTTADATGNAIAW